MIQGVLTKCVFEGMKDLYTNPEKMHAQVAKWTEDIKTATDMDPVLRAALLAFLPSLDQWMQVIPKIEGPSNGGTWMPVTIESVAVSREWKGPKNSFEISFPQGMIWGVMGCAAAFGLSLVIERTKGTLVRLQMAPLSRTQILAGKGGACFAATLFLQIVLFLIGIIVFGIRPSSLPLLGLAIVATTICFVGIMMLLSTLGRTEQAAAGVGWAILLVMAMIGGGMVPQFIMPAWLLNLSIISPIRWAIQAMDGAIWRQFSAAEMAVPCGVLVAIGVGCFVLGAQTFRWTHEG